MNALTESVMDDCCACISNSVWEHVNECLWQQTKNIWSITFQQIDRPTFMTVRQSLYYNIEDYIENESIN